MVKSLKNIKEHSISSHLFGHQYTHSVPFRSLGHQSDPSFIFPNTPPFPVTIYLKLFWTGLNQVKSNRIDLIMEMVVVCVM